MCIYVFLSLWFFCVYDVLCIGMCRYDVCVCMYVCVQVCLCMSKGGGITLVGF